MASAPEAMRGLLGENLFFGTAKPGSMVDMRKFGEATIRSKTVGAGLVPARGQVAQAVKTGRDEPVPHTLSSWRWPGSGRRSRSPPRSRSSSCRGSSSSPRSCDIRGPYRMDERVGDVRVVVRRPHQQPVVRGVKHDALAVDRTGPVAVPHAAVPDRDGARRTLRGDRRPSAAADSSSVGGRRCPCVPGITNVAPAFLREVVARPSTPVSIMLCAAETGSERTPGSGVQGRLGVALRTDRGHEAPEQAGRGPPRTPPAPSPSH